MCDQPRRLHRWTRTEKRRSFPGVLPRLCDGAFFFSIRLLHVTLHFVPERRHLVHTVMRTGVPFLLTRTPLQVGRPGPPGLPVRVAYPVAGQHAFTQTVQRTPCHIFPPDIVCGQSKSQNKVVFTIRPDVWQVKSFKCPVSLAQTRKNLQ